MNQITGQQGKGHMGQRATKKMASKGTKVKKTETKLAVAQIEQETARIKRSQVIWAKIITALYPVTPFVISNWDSVVVKAKVVLVLFGIH